MSTTLGAVRALVQDSVDDDSDDTALIIDRTINQSYREVAAMHFWQALKRYWLISSSILPGDLERMFYVEPANTDYLYFPMSEQDRYTNYRLYSWFLNMTVVTPILTGTDMIVVANDATVTSATGGFVTATHVGEYIRIGVDGGIYKIDSVTDTNTIELDHAYRGIGETGQFFEIRPEGTLQLSRSDEQGDLITTVTDKLWYLARPIPLYNAYDSIPLPGTCDAIRIMALQRHLEGDKYDNDALKQQPNFVAALSSMKAHEPVVGGSPRVRDQFGYQMAFGRQGYRRASRLYGRRATD